MDNLARHQRLSVVVFFNVLLGIAVLAEAGQILDTKVQNVAVIFYAGDARRKNLHSRADEHTMRRLEPVRPHYQLTTPVVTSLFMMALFTASGRKVNSILFTLLPFSS